MNAYKYTLYFFLFILLTSCGAGKYGRDAMVAKNIGEYYKAIENFRKAVRKDKDRFKRREYTYEIAECYNAIGDYERASIYYGTAIKRGYENPVVFLKYAEMLRSAQKYEEAIENYEIFLDSIPKDERALQGLESIRKTQEWVAKPTRHIVNPVKELNSREADYSPIFVGGRDNEIIFTSNRKAATGKKKSMITGQKYADLFKSTFGIQKQKWEEPKLLDESLIINTGDEEGAAILTSNSEQILFTRCRYDKKQALGTEIFSSTQSRGNWSEPIKVKMVRDSLVTAHPALSPDGSKLYFVSDMPGGLGGKDIWVAEKKGGSFSNAVNLGPEINTPGNELFPFVRDNGELYFSSDSRIGMGGLDIYKAKQNDEGKWLVENMGYPVNSPGDDFGIAFVKGQEKGMFTSSRKGSKGDDIYTFVVPPKVFQAEGEVFDKETGAKMEGAMVRIIGTDGTNMKMRAQEGKFQLKLQPEVDYIIAAFKDGYLRDKAIASTRALEDSKDFRFSFYLTPYGNPVDIENINYAFGSAELLEESKKSLDTLVQILNENPTITIELMSHTDHIGGDQFNFELSQKRAQSVVNFLVEKGINPQRLVAKGYGETWPKKVTRELAIKYDFLKRNDELTESYILKLTPEQQEIAKQLNRRTEFRVLSTDYIEKFDAEPQK